MTRIYHDQFAKQCLAGFLAPFGTTEISREITSEVRQVDVWFEPHGGKLTVEAGLGALGRMAQMPCLLEAFRNRVQADHVLGCQSKLNAARLELMRRAESQNLPLAQSARPRLWVLSPSVSQSVLQGFGAQETSNWYPGIFFLPNHQRTALVSIRQLPVNLETLWLRLLGRDRVQEAAIAELIALPSDHPFRSHALEQLANLRITIQTRQNLTNDERGLIMTLSPVYERWQTETLQQGRQEGRQEEGVALVLRQLTRKMGTVDDSTRAQIEALPLPLLEDLGEALLDFSSETDLGDWLATHRSVE